MANQTQVVLIVLIRDNVTMFIIFGSTLFLPPILWETEIDLLFKQPSHLAVCYVWLPWFEVNKCNSSKHGDKDMILGVLGREYDTEDNDCLTYWRLLKSLDKLIFL